MCKLLKMSGYLVSPDPRESQHSRPMIVVGHAVEPVACVKLVSRFALATIQKRVGCDHDESRKNTVTVLLPVVVTSSIITRISGFDRGALSS